MSCPCSIHSLTSVLGEPSEAVFDVFIRLLLHAGPCWSMLCPCYSVKYESNRSRHIKIINYVESVVMCVVRLSIHSPRCPGSVIISCIKLAQVLTTKGIRAESRCRPD